MQSEKRALRRRAQQNAQSFFGGEEANSCKLLTGLLKGSLK